MVQRHAEERLRPHRAASSLALHPPTALKPADVGADVQRFYRLPDAGMAGDQVFGERLRLSNVQHRQTERRTLPRLPDFGFVHEVFRSGQVASGHDADAEPAVCADLVTPFNHYQLLWPYDSHCRASLVFALHPDFFKSTPVSDSDAPV